MHPWAKRGMQTALVTGGLLMLGTGIASAHEDASPDKPANPLDVSVDVPVHTQDNQLSTPLGKADLPDVHHDFKTPSVNDMTGHRLDPKHATGAKQANGAPDGAADQEKSKGNAADHAGAGKHRLAGSGAKALPKAADKATPDGVSKAVDKATPDGVHKPAGKAKREGAGKAADKATSALRGVSDKAPGAPSSAGQGNKVDANLTVPIELCGNAVGVLADSSVSGSCSQTSKHDQDVNTDGQGGALAGNVVKGDGAVPVQATGNALGVLGHARSDYHASQRTGSTGDITTNGKESLLGGNAAGLSPAVPVQANGLAGGVLGKGTANSQSGSYTRTGGWIETNGERSVLGGAGLGGALAPSASAQDAAFGNANSNIADSKSPQPNHVTKVTSGDGKPDASDIPMYVSTSGKDSLLGGSSGATDGATPISLCGIAGGSFGEADANCGAQHTSKAGGATVTDGTGSAGGGNAAHTPVAFPVNATGIAGGVLGKGVANSMNESDARAGGSVAPVRDRTGNTFTNGNDSIGGANVAGLPVANSGDLCAIAGGFLGEGAANCGNDVTGKAGGYDGSLGNDSALAGNVVGTPIAIPAEVLGIAGNGLGNATAHSVEKKELNSGGEGNSYDDNGLVSSNVVQEPAAVPAQLFGIAGGGGGAAAAKADTQTDTTAGGQSNARADGRGLSGNIVTAPLAAPAQLFGLAGSVAGVADGVGNNETSASSGGPNTTSGRQSVGSANVVAIPAGLIAQGFGDSVGVISKATGTGVNDTSTTAGGSTSTTGSDAVFSGNVVQGVLDPVVQGFGDAVGVFGNNHADGINKVDQQVGDDVQTDGSNGFVSGNIGNGSGQGLGQLFGNAVSALGTDSADGTNVVDSVAGGDAQTDATDGTISGNVLGAELAPLGRLFGNGVGAAGGPVAAATDSSELVNGGAHQTTPGGFGSGIVGDLPVELAPSAFGNGVGALGSTVVAAAADNIQGTNSVPEPDGYQLPLGLAPSVHGVAAPILSEVAASGIADGDLVNAGEQVLSPALSPDQLPGAGELPGADQLLDADQLPGADQLPAKTASTRSAQPVQLPDASKVVSGNLDSVGSGLTDAAKLHPGNLHAPTVSGLGDNGKNIATV